MTSLPTSAPTGPAPLAHTKEAIPKISADTPGASPASGVFSFPSRRADFRPARLGQDFLFYPLLTRHKACFHPFASPSHTPQGVFSSFMHKRTFVFSLAPSGAFSFVCLPILTRSKACFHSSCKNARLCFHSRPQARFHSFSPHAAQPRALFRTRTSG